MLLAILTHSLADLGSEGMLMYVYIPNITGLIDATVTYYGDLIISFSVLVRTVRCSSLSPTLLLASRIRSWVCCVFVPYSSGVISSVSNCS